MCNFRHAIRQLNNEIKSQGPRRTKRPLSRND